MEEPRSMVDHPCGRTSDSLPERGGGEGSTACRQSRAICPRCFRGRTAPRWPIGTRDLGLLRPGIWPLLPPRLVPIRFRKSIPTSWLRMTLREGRNRQIRKMTASVGCPTLRIVRVRIGPLSIGGLKPGEKRMLTAAEIDELQHLVGIAPH